jgi:hypothetical protein
MARALAVANGQAPMPAGGHVIRVPFEANRLLDDFRRIPR